MATKTEKRAAPRAKRSKADVQKEFEELKEALEDREEADVKLETVAKAREEAVRHEVAEIGVEAVVQRIAGLGLEVSRAIGDISEKLSAEVRLLGTLREAVALERRELERLHQIDVAATSLDHLVEEHTRRKQELEAEIAGERAAWEAERSRVERERREQEDVQKKQRQREVEDYEYRKGLERKKAQDKHDEEQRQLERKNAERQEALEKEWQRRETALKDREDRLARLEAEVAEFPARLLRETEAAVKEARREVELQLDRQILLLKKDAEAEARVAQLGSKALEQSLASSTAQIAALEKQLAEAKQQVQDIAIRAIEGASGARALAHINQIAMEQAKNRPPG